MNESISPHPEERPAPRPDGEPTPEPEPSPQPAPEHPADDAARPAASPTGGPYADLPPPAPRESGFFGWIRSLQMPRSSDRWVGGVVGGLADRVGIDHTLARGIFVVLGLLSLVGPFIYGVLWALMPEPDGRIHAQEAGRGRWSSGMTGAVIFTALGLFTGPAMFGWRWEDSGFGFFRVLLSIAVIGFIIYLLTTTRHGRDPRGTYVPPADPNGQPVGPNTPRATTNYSATPNYSYSYQYSYPETAPQQPGTYVDPRAQQSYERAAQRQQAAMERAMRPKLQGSVALIFLGVAVLAAGAVLLAQIEGWVNLPGFGFRTAIAAALMVLGVGLLTAAAMRRRGGALVPFTIILLIISMFTTLRSDARWNNYPAYTGTGAGIERPVVFGNRTIDLTERAHELTADDTVHVTGVFSNVHVTIPNDRKIIIVTDGAFYSVRSTDAQGLTNNTSGVALDNAQLVFNEKAEGPTLTLRIDGAFGNLDVTTEAN